MRSEAPGDRGALSLDTAALARLERLEIRVRTLVESARGGVHRSPHRGAGVAFQEHVAYRPGDDLRRIDWKASARLDRHVQKRFEQDAALRAWLLVDSSGSMHFPAPPARGPTKFECAAAGAGALAHLLAGQRDLTGLIAADASHTVRVPPGGGRAHVRRLLESLAAVRAQASAGEPAALIEAAQTAERRRGLLVLFSDLLGASASLGAAIGRAVARGHEVWVVQVLSTEELELPYQGPTRFLGAEGEGAVDADADGVRAAYLRALAAWLEETRHAVVDAGAHHVLTRAGDPADAALASLIERAARAAGHGGVA